MKLLLFYADLHNVKILKNNLTILYSKPFTQSSGRGLDTDPKSNRKTSSYCLDRTVSFSQRKEDIFKKMQDLFY